MHLVSVWFKPAFDCLAIACLPSPAMSGAEPVRDGIVISFWSNKGYGFIKPMDGSSDVFMHSQSIVGVRHSATVLVGAHVQFETTLYDSKTRAANVVLVKPGSGHVDSTPESGQNPKVSNRDRSRSPSRASTASVALLRELMRAQSSSGSSEPLQGNRIRTALEDMPGGEWERKFDERGNAYYVNTPSYNARGEIVYKEVVKEATLVYLRNKLG